MTLKKEKDSFNKLVQLLSEMVGQAISLSVVEPETKTADFVKNWLDNHYEEVGAAFGSSCYYGQGLDEAAEEYEKNEVHSISALGTDKDGFAHYMRSGTTFAEAFKAGAKWMAEQGFTVDAVVGVNAFGQGYFFPCNDIPDMHYGDKVIAQIRKKEE